MYFILLIFRFFIQDSDFSLQEERQAGSTAGDIEEAGDTEGGEAGESSGDKGKGRGRGTRGRGQTKKRGQG